MARTTKALSGAAKDKVLLGLAESVEAVPADVARQISDVLARNISEVRVRRDTWEALKEKRVPAPPTTAPAVAPADKLPTRTTKPSVTATEATTAPASLAEPFDPFAFSAVAVLTRKGKAALVGELEKIVTAAHLRDLATAQHLAIDPTLMDAAAIRSALVLATERRIAERKAAAS